MAMACAWGVPSGKSRSSASHVMGVDGKGGGPFAHDLPVAEAVKVNMPSLEVNACNAQSDVKGLGMRAHVGNHSGQSAEAQEKTLSRRGQKGPSERARA